MTAEPEPGARIGTAVAAVIVTGAVLWAAIQVGVDDVPRSERFALSPQECNTECQSRQTDCVDTCEGNVACERRCIEVGFACVERCKRMAADAGVGGAAGRGATGGTGGASGAGGAPNPQGGAAGRGGAPP